MGRLGNAGATRSCGTICKTLEKDGDRKLIYSAHTHSLGEERFRRDLGYSMGRGHEHSRMGGMFKMDLYDLFFILLVLFTK